jgi:predicted permease
MQTLMKDLRYALRQLRLAPVFSLTAMMTLALGIGATTAIFSLVHAVMLRSLPVVDPASLWRIGDTQECCVEGGLQSDGWSLFSYQLYERLQAAAPEFEQLAAFQASANQFNVRRGDEPAKPLRGEYVSGNYFTMFGVGSFAGRIFSPADDTPAAPPAAVLSYRSWQQTYGADPKMVGSILNIQGQPFTVIGIAPPGFFGDTLSSDPPQLWIPLQQEPLVEGTSSVLRQPFTNWLRAIGRLKPGATVAGMNARLTTVLRQWIPESGIPSEFMPEVQRHLKEQNIRMSPAGGGVGAMKADYGSSLKILLIVCSMVLLIACANIANLLLARGAARRQQTVVQLALGASRSRLIRQSLTESIVLGLLGGVLGLVVAFAGTRLILLLAFHSAKFLPIRATPSLPVLGFAFALSLLTGALFGTAPAWLATRAHPAEALRGANRTTRDTSSLPQRLLVIGQATISVVLVTAAGMLTHSLRNLEHRDFGFATQNRVTVWLNDAPASYTPEHLLALNQQLQDRLSHLPGVERAALAMYTPFTDNWGEGVAVEGKPINAFGDDSGSSWDRVSAGFFETMGQKVLRGRGIEEQDTAGSLHVAVVNETFAKHFFKGEDPLGKHFGMDLPAYSSSYTIVGVVRDAKYTDPQGKTRAMFFLPLTQSTHFQEPVMQIVDTRSHFIHGAVLLFHGDLGLLEPQIRKAVAEVDPNLTITGIQTLDEQVASQFDQQRAVAQLAGLFGGLALLLAGVGLYGVTAYTVARRTSEIGVRMALGANRRNVIRLVLRGALQQVLIGLIIGIPMAIIAGRLMGAQLFEVKSFDPAALAAAVCMLGIAAVVAAFIPAQRAASINPVVALRTE